MVQYQQQIIRANNTNSAWRKLRVILRKKGLTLTKQYGKAVKIKPYTYKIYYVSQRRNK